MFRITLIEIQTHCNAITNDINNLGKLEISINIWLISALYLVTYLNIGKRQPDTD